MLCIAPRLISFLGKFLGVYAIHPVTKKKLPIYLAPYVIADYGTGTRELSLAN